MSLFVSDTLIRTQAEELKQELIDHSKDISPDDQPVTNGMHEHKIPDDIRKLKLAQVMRLLDTQYACPTYENRFPHTNR